MLVLLVVAIFLAFLATFNSTFSNDWEIVKRCKKELGPVTDENEIISTRVNSEKLKCILLS